MGIFDAIQPRLHAARDRLSRSAGGAGAAIALQATQASAAETKSAIAAAQQAAQGPLDSESSRLAQETRWRQLPRHAGCGLVVRAGYANVAGEVTVTERQAILDRHTEMKTVRSLEEPEWRDIAMVLKPEDRIFDVAADGQRRRGRQPDLRCDAALCTRRLRRRPLFSQATNPSNRWFELSLLDQDLAKWQPVKKWLWQASN